MIYECCRIHIVQAMQRLGEEAHRQTLERFHWRIAVRRCDHVFSLSTPLFGLFATANGWQIADIWESSARSHRNMNWFLLALSFPVVVLLSSRRFCGVVKVWSRVRVRDANALGERPIIRFYLEKSAGRPKKATVTMPSQVSHGRCFSQPTATNHSK